MTSQQWWEVGGWPPKQVGDGRLRPLPHLCSVCTEQTQHVDRTFTGTLLLVTVPADRHAVAERLVRLLLRRQPVLHGDALPMHRRRQERGGREGVVLFVRISHLHPRLQRHRQHDHTRQDSGEVPDRRRLRGRPDGVVLLRLLRRRARRSGTQASRPEHGRHQAGVTRVRTRRRSTFLGRAYADVSIMS